MESSATASAAADLAWGAFTEDGPWVLDRDAIRPRIEVFRA